jgi:hypothetical protein
MKLRWYNKRTMTQEYPIPKCLWESLDAVLYSKGISLAKEIAKEMKVPLQPLLSLLNKEDRTKFIISPDDNNTYQCQAIIQSGSTLMRCRCATLGLVAKFCFRHERCSNDITVNLPLVKRIIAPEGIYMAKGLIVYRLNGSRCGFIKDTRLSLFEIEE